MTFIFGMFFIGLRDFLLELYFDIDNLLVDIGGGNTIVRYDICAGIVMHVVIILLKPRNSNISVYVVNHSKESEMCLRVS